MQEVIFEKVEANVEKAPEILASRKRRLFARFIDFLILDFLLIVVEILQFEGGLESIGLGIKIILIIIAIIQAVLLTKYGQSIGKKIFKLKIVKRDTGENGGFLTNVLIRNLVISMIGVAQLNVFPIPVIMILDWVFIFGKDKRCLHDILAGTKVIRA
jgi:uncharacterized RDD family membrane protein YckC